MSFLTKLIVAGIIAIIWAGVPAYLWHEHDIKVDAANLQKQADGYNAVYAKAQADSAAQLKAAQTQAAEAVGHVAAMEAQIQTHTTKTITVIKNAPPEKCLDAAVPATVLQQLRQPPDYLRP